jgi:hypothetical protein
MLVNVWLRVTGCDGGQCEARLGELLSFRVSESVHNNVKYKERKVTLV